MLPRNGQYISTAHAPSSPRRGRLLNLLHVVDLWLQRSRQRRALAALGEDHLKDIGLSRSTAARETAKPFWRK